MYFSIYSEWSLEIVDLCEEFRNRHVVGLDIAGDESMGEIPAMKEHILAFLVPSIYLLLTLHCCTQCQNTYVPKFSLKIVFLFNCQ